MFENCSLVAQNLKDKRFYRTARPALNMRCYKLGATECHEPLYERPSYAEAARRLIDSIQANPMLSDEYLSLLFPRDKFTYHFSSYKDPDPYEGGNCWDEYEYITYHISGYQLSVTFSYLASLNRLEMVIRIGARSDIHGSIDYYDLLRGGEEKIKSFLCSCLAIFQYVEKELLDFNKK